MAGIPKRKRKGPAKKVGFLTSKGGSGKTMLSLNTAACLASAGYQILLVDHDREGSLNDFFTTREDLGKPDLENLEFVYHPKDDLHLILNNADLLEKYDFIFVDGAPGADSNHLRSEVTSVDVILIPIQPAMSELVRARKLIDLINEAKAEGNKIDTYFLPSRVIEGTRIAKGFIDALDNEDGIDRIKVGTWNRVAYPESMSNYQTVAEWEPKSKAASEIAAISKTVFNLLTTTKKGK